MNICVILFIFELAILCYIIYLINCQKINNYLQENFYIKPECNEPKIKQLQDIISPMFAEDVKYTGILENINKKKILHDISLCKGDKSYTINKEDIYLCLKDENDKYYDDNMLIYVLLHEVAHSICHEIGHTPLFQKIFDALLDKASEMNIYDKNIPIVRNYCKVTSSYKV